MAKIRLSGPLISATTTAANRMKIKRAQHWLSLNLGLYVLIAGIELLVGWQTHAAVLLADGENNVTGSFATILLLVGLHFAAKPSDAYHVEGHWQFESLAVFLSGLSMVLVGLNCIWLALRQTWSVWQLGRGTLSGIVLYPAGASAVILLVEAGLNHWQGQRFSDSALLASAQDYFSDAVTSGVTVLALCLTMVTHWPLIDTLSAVGLGGYICWTGGQILSRSAAKLSNGFDPERQVGIAALILTVPGVQGIKAVHGRYVGDSIVLELAIQVAPQLTVIDTVQLRQKLCQRLASQESLLYCWIEFWPS
ncbi:cation diffusion facilitator family transporter [Lactiplantibacillus songbeiensis]|uniref:Cation diffusion facilitator family transporter n=1 Tax=Lactiplantibacillus songbeiensis TaxID=2559920 RepID=A0ABW4C2E9_9LACO|nr:cation diffusion facilitator family transporter [Lactiplantibacillus songbeiensis]